MLLTLLTFRQLNRDLPQRRKLKLKLKLKLLLFIGNGLKARLAQ